MSAGPDLQVDTGWIRRSAATLDETGRRLGSAATDAGPVVPTGSLGSDGDSVARLIDLRCAQANQAAGQLADIADGVAQKLTVAANTFDRLDAGVRGPR